MFVLGLILILLSAGALVAVLASGTDDQAAMYGGSVNVPTLVIFLAGAAALLLFIMGLELVRSGVKRANRSRQNNKRLRKLEKREKRRDEEGTRDEAPAGDAPTRSHTDTGSDSGSPIGTPASSETTRTDTPADTARTDGEPYQTPPPSR